ncbi:unnamed protein product [Psylliodes chrysocephalus]|uniref:Uncharacterized protein n=1 Tax=Psylliodes chrysocephalus TaxID=3402493 RepID=A0A9P0CW15_9CUCU|nr:unnamed protein product [Psylliodes chrysocephala]
MSIFVTFFAFALFVVAIPLATADVVDKPAETEECLKISGASEANVFARPRKMDPEIQCFWKCVLEKKGVISPDGVFNIDLFDKGFPKAAASLGEDKIAMVKKCFGTVGKIKTCDDMSQIRQCFTSVVKA